MPFRHISQCPVKACQCPSSYVRVCESCSILAVCSAGARKGYACDPAAGDCCLRGRVWLSANHLCYRVLTFLCLVALAFSASRGGCLGTSGEPGTKSTRLGRKVFAVLRAAELSKNVARNQVHDRFLRLMVVFRQLYHQNVV